MANRDDDRAQLDTKCIVTLVDGTDEAPVIIDDISLNNPVTISDGVLTIVYKEKTDDRMKFDRELTKKYNPDVWRSVLIDKCDLPESRRPGE